MSRTRPIFRKRHRRLLRLPAVIAALLAAVVACAPESSHWSPSQSVKRNDLRWIAFEHEVRFDRDDKALGQAEKDRLHRFLALHDAGYGDDVMIGAAGRPARPSDRQRAADREAAVMAEFSDRSLQLRRLPDVPGHGAWTGSVKVVLGRFVVLPPDCPDWSKPADGDPNNRPSSNFGCATATNLGLMLANPGDLVRGRRPGPADGVAGARLYRAYRDGEQKQAPAVTPLIIQSGVGGASGG